MRSKNLTPKAAIIAAIFLLSVLAQTQQTRAVLLVTEDAHIALICTSCASLTTTFTVGAHPNETMIAYIFIEPNFAINDPIYNGLTFTYVNSVCNSLGSSTVPFCAVVEKLVNPTQGAHTISVSFGGTGTAEMYLVDFYNTEPSNPIDGSSVQSCYWQQCSGTSRTMNMHTRNTNEYISSWIAVGSFDTSIGTGEITSRSTLTNVASTSFGVAPNAEVESLDTLSPQPVASGDYSGTYTLSHANDADVLFGIALNPTGQGVGGSTCVQLQNCTPISTGSNNASLAAIINFMVPFFIILTPAVLFWQETHSEFLLLVGALLGSAIAASAGLIANWLPFLFAIAIIAWMFRGSRG